MPMIDLTIPIDHGIESFPGEPGSFFIPFASIARQGFLSHQMLLYSHGGTHVDAPRHFLPGGGDVASMPLDKLVGPAMVADVKVQGEEIRLADIHWPRVPAPGDRVLLRTGWGRHWGRDDYFASFPNLGLEVAQYLAEKGVGLLGLDTPTPHSKEPLAVHEALLSREIVIVEGLVNLERITGTEGMLLCLPLPLVGLDGAPARVVYIEDGDGLGR